MTAHTRLAPPLVESIRKALTAKCASRRNPGPRPRDEREAAEFLAEVAAQRKPRRARAGDRIDRRRGRPPPDAHRHRQRRHAVPGRFGRQRDRRAPADHPPPASPGRLRRPRRRTACCASVEPLCADKEPARIDDVHRARPRRRARPAGARRRLRARARRRPRSRFATGPSCRPRCARTPRRSTIRKARRCSTGSPTAR